MQAGGVIFHDLWESVREIARSPPGTTIKISDSVFNRLLDPAQAQFAVTPFSTEELAVLRAMQAYSTRPANDYGHMEYNGVAVVVLDDGAHNSCYDHPSRTIITGYTSHSTSPQKVQLIFQDDASPLDQVMAFYASHVQSFISGFGAAHLYHTLDVKAKAIHWTNNTQHYLSSLSAIEKYTARGWTVLTSPTPPLPTISQLATSKSSKLMLFEEPHTKLLKARSTAFANFAWETSESETRRLHSVPPSLKNATRLTRWRQGVYATDVDRMHAETMALTMRHSAAFESDYDEQFPDQIGGL